MVELDKVYKMPTRRNRLYTVLRCAPHGRQRMHDGEQEEHLPEAGVMLAYAMHLFDLGATHVEIRPDGEHGNRFDIRSWLESDGFRLVKPVGATTYCGTYKSGSRELMVRSVPGDGDVIWKSPEGTVIAECKGGILNTRHAGQKSKLRRAVVESVGQLLCRPNSGERQVAVVPDTAECRTWANRVAPRARLVGIEIALVSRDGSVTYVAEF
jgi:hypothetical protein